MVIAMVFILISIAINIAINMMCTRDDECVFRLMNAHSTEEKTCNTDVTDKHRPDAIQLAQHVQFCSLQTEA